MVNIKKLKARMLMLDMNVESLAEKMGVNKVTMYRKMNSPEKLTQEEMERIAGIVDIDTVGMMDIFFSKE